MSSGFISETEIVEQRRRRQEEWEKVRTEDQPKEAPEEPYVPLDNRPLFTRLEEQRMKKEAEFEEAHKLKNMIRGLDDDEVGFLDLVESTKAKAAQQIFLEEKKEMQEFRERVSNLTESEEMVRLRAQLAPTRPAQPAAPTQKNMLLGMIVRKRKASEADGDKQDKDASTPKLNGLSKNITNSSPEATEATGLRCVGVLPGLGHYENSDTSSDTDNSSESDTEENCCSKRDLLGRHEHEKKKGDEDKS